MLTRRVHNEEGSRAHRRRSSAAQTSICSCKKNFSRRKKFWGNVVHLHREWIGNLIKYLLKFRSTLHACRLLCVKALINYGKFTGTNSILRVKVFGARTRGPSSSSTLDIEIEFFPFMLSLILGALISLESISSISQWKIGLRIFLFCESLFQLFIVDFSSSFLHFSSSFRVLQFFFCAPLSLFFSRVPQWILIMRYGIHFEYCWVQGVGRVRELVEGIFIKSNYVARNVFTLENLPDNDNPRSFQVLAMFLPFLSSLLHFSKDFKCPRRLERHSMPDNWYLKSFIIVCDEDSSGWMSCDPSTQCKLFLCQISFCSPKSVIGLVVGELTKLGKLDGNLHLQNSNSNFTWTYTPKNCFSSASHRAVREI